MIFKVKDAEAAAPEHEVTWSVKIDGTGNLLVRAETVSRSAFTILQVKHDSGELDRYTCISDQLKRLGLPFDGVGRIAET